MSEEIKSGDNGKDVDDNGGTQVKVKPVMSIDITEDGKVMFRTSQKLTIANKEFYLNILTDVMKAVINAKEEVSKIVQPNLGVAGFRRFLNRR